MDTLASILLTKALAATALGLVAALAARRLRRPQIVHALWTLVLLYLLAPPLLRVGVLPALDPAPIAAMPSAAIPPGPLPEIERGASPLPWARIAEGISLGGTALLMGLVVLRAQRFRRRLRGAPAAPPELQRRTRELAAFLGVRAPLVRIVPARISPLLRPTLRGLEILLPQDLLARLAPDERDAVIAHELAHVRRRDAWARVLELAATLVFWWHPLVYVARSALRRAEEASCDAWVLRILPGHGPAYARGLVETVEWLAGAPRGLPALASGLGSFQLLEERLTMILTERTPKPLSKPVVWIGVAAALTIVVVFPTWADRGTSGSGSTGTGKSVAVVPHGVAGGVVGGVPGGVVGGVLGGVSGGVVGGVLGGVEAGVGSDDADPLEREMREIEASMERLARRREELARELGRRRDRVSVAGSEAEVAERARLQADQLRVEAEVLARQQQAEVMRSLAERERIARSAAELERRRAELDRELGRGELEPAAALERARMELEAELEKQRAHGGADAAAEIERRMRELDVARRSLETPARRAALASQVEALQGALDTLSASPVRDAAEREALEQRIDEVKRRIEALETELERMGGDPR